MSKAKCGHRDGTLVQFWPGDLFAIGRALDGAYSDQPERFEVFRRTYDWRNFTDEYLALSGDEVALWQLEIEQLQRFLFGEEYMGFHEQESEAREIGRRGNFHLEKGRDTLMTDEQVVWPGGAPQVGQRAELTREVSRHDIELFTAISGDRNPLHYDEELAKATKFGRIVVQGGVTSAILNAVVAEKLPGPGTVFLHVDWSFKAPVRPGDKITGAVEVVNVRTDKPITEVKTTVTRDDGTVVLDGNALCYTMPLAR